MSGFVDLQVNGYGGVDFNAPNLCVDDVSRACSALQRDGVESILATLITDDLDSMEAKIHAIVTAHACEPQVRAVIDGLHLEGPFLNPDDGFIGAHPREFARPADRQEMGRLCDACDGLLRLVTLAPEQDAGASVTRWLTDQGILVSAGHCDASLDQLKAAIDAGLSMLTHLGNGCPRSLDRHDNIIQRGLSLAGQLYIGFIADGIHVPFPALGNYLRLAGWDRAFIVTDAVAAAGQGPGKYWLGGQKVVVDEDLATWCEDGSHLVGSAMNMQRVCHNLSLHLGLPDDTIQNLTSCNARRILAGGLK